MTGHLHRDVPVPGLQVEFDGLRETRQVVHTQHDVGASVLLEFTHIRQHRRVRAAQLAERPDRECVVPAADGQHRAGPVQQRGRGVALGFDVDRLVAVDRILVGRQVEPPRGGGGEAGVAVGGPLHRSAHRVAVAQPDDVAHSDLVAVVQHRRTGKRQQQRGEQLHLVAVVVQQRRQAPADADVGLHARILGVLRVHVVALFVGDHLQRELVVVAQEDPPLRHLRDVRGLGEDLRDRETRLAAHRHEDAGHQREVEGHVAFVATGLGVPEVLDDVGGPLVGLGEQHPARELVVDHLAAVLQEGVGLGQVLAVGALPLEQVGHRVEAKPVDAQVQPEPQHVDHRFLHRRVVVVQIGLVREEPVPVELPPHRVERPVGLLGVDEDDPRVGVGLAGVTPDEEVAVGAVWVTARFLEPRMLIGGVVHDEVGDDADAATVCRVQQLDEILDGAEFGQHLVEVPDVVAAVAQRGVVEGRQPQAVHAQPLHVVHSLGQAS